VPELWVPGVGEPSIEAFVERLHRHIERFASERAGGNASVEVELRDGSVLRLESVLAEPGFGFVTLCPHVEEGGGPEEIVVPVAAISRIRLSPPEEEPPLGFAAPKKS
jgi:hypothetical protein